MTSKDFRDQLGKFRLEAPALLPVTWSSPTTTSFSKASPRAQPSPSPLARPPSSTPQPPPPSDSLSPLDSTTATATATATRSKRVSTACDFCRKRKKKCDFRYPNCSACTRAGVRCTVPPPGPQVASASVPRDQLETLQNRVRWLEEIVHRKVGIAVANMATGSSVDGGSDPDWWCRVPAMIASSATRSSLALPTPHPLSTTPTTMLSPFANSSTSTPPGLAAIATEPPTGVGVELPNVGEILRDQLENRRPSVARPAVAPRVLRLSSLEEAERVAGQYFDSLGYQYPFLPRSEFFGHLRHIYKGGVPAPEVHNTYHIIIAIALLIGSAEPAQATDFYQASQETLSHALQNEDLPSIRALLGLALYSMFATSGPSIWHVLGATLRLAISMGLHKARPYPTPMEEEMAKRAFWSLYNLDRLIASTLGRPLGISDDDISVGLPRELNEDGMEAPGASIMTIPLQVIRLRRIFSRIYHYLYSNLPQLPPEEAAATLAEFRREVDDWRFSAPVYPSALLYSTSYYDYLYYTTLLLMYRPSPRNPHPDTISVISCGDSSIQVIRSYWDSYSVGKLKWIWLTLSQVYFAGITILWCLEQNARCLRDSRPPMWQPDEQMMRRAIQAVVVLLEQFGKRRPGVDRLAETFRHQSTTIFTNSATHPAHATTASAPQLAVTLAPPPPPPVPLAPVLDDVLLVDGSGAMPMIDPQMAEQLYYSYNWFQEEMASYYTL
ncbi:hypothetical protein N7539_006000 [Penicillium diatomitis]|uniref:Zn(2)-C6 fungal-type domain-containing protein n=1 Tax=Penicillium diatomitis TaxID=2819901 RepID=A0A9W9X6P8_9EURO|nr:uncharacterized protein N7539_006000 [Penicillium diatomitis]KAJ5484204.1 hypothetical protein N7539_006000 [Penicillium diatomitis]